MLVFSASLGSAARWTSGAKGSKLKALALADAALKSVAEGRAVKVSEVLG